MAENTEHPAYPVGLRLAGRRVVVLGGGQVAQRRLPALIAAGADVTLISPSATPSVDVMAETGEITWIKRRYEEGDLADAWYALVATTDPTANAAASAEAERTRTWCVRADDAEAATAWTPATGRDAGVTVAVLTGHDPRRSAAVRDAIVEGLRDGSLAAPAHRDRTPFVALVGGGPGDPDLITVRGRRLLAEADVVIADRLGPRDLLDELPPHVEVIDAAKIPYGRFMAQEAINNALIEHAKQGKSVVRLKGGDPFVFGRGMEEAQALAAEGIACTVVPGISSSISVPGAVGIPVTHRGVAHEFTVVSGHVAPDDPRSLVDWASLAKLTGTLVILMGVDKIGKIAEALIAHGKSPDTPLALVQEGTTATQRRVDATLATVADVVQAEEVRPPAVIVIGPVVAEGPDKLTK
ncbi:MULTISPECIES: uroporphyrinogen-III C-methyltransferase [Streptomyces]|jgi:uroporphyrin-III C-methyltransferase / precorrin-2 dehydrogenase / sirohydrochlorin ferrochelatase|uniref:Uroporphyrin-III C-methyltransferase/precorrin-2 dehydrogenase/sirohydrochlorin ferrochelatase n=1 Tax=Streptomyces nymphaeiformis TaxID=2663842 RepID=A0A7W7U692_9ACTN|nr:uroporphyrinogen-III C-methyltransferase [Streptomyces nymphaeiformis]MBB4985633.1 uroporphyrin-III C-methyltransferase/precorrin-2 dehydrogenase/sirohydrochlorin ferrochelatase [Streptomyces nymphaeiformis]